VHVYFANWGTRRLMFRLPLHAVDLDDLRTCVPGGPVTLTVTEHHVVLDLWSETEEPEEDWFEDGQPLASLTPLRAELLRGDRRVAYLAWLLAVQAGELDPDTPEPRVPHGLDADSASLAALTGFLRVDPDLLAAAAEAGIEDTGELERFRSWVERLPAREQQRWLLRAADNLDLAVGSVLLGEVRRAHPPVVAERGRTVAQLLERAEELRAERRRESIKRGLRPGWQTSGGGTARRTGSPRP
jgi:antitoxin (DNA-binding transcriptional repressor) of toxin-antitoxin stability system